VTVDDILQRLTEARGILKVYVTKRCNLGCVMCDNWRHRPAPGEELATEQWKALIADARRIGFRKIVFFGGEPTLRGDLVELVAHAHALGYKLIRVYTHTFNLNERRLDALMEAGVNRFSVSMDSPHADINDGIRGQAGVWARTVEVLGLLRERKSRHPGTAVHLNSTIQGPNFRDLPLLFDLAHGWGVDSVTVTPLIAKGGHGTLRTIDDASLTPSQEAEYTEVIAPLLWRKSQSYGFELTREDVYVFDAERRSSSIRRYQEEYPCFIPWTRLIIREDGRVVGCNKIANRLRTLGDGRSQRLGSILDGPDSTRFREACLTTGSYPKMPGCENCCFGQAAENRTVARLLGLTPSGGPA
jgi:MoaA/NifB/PqqE/SkfB family radical SAM enzyme